MPRTPKVTDSTAQTEKPIAQRRKPRFKLETLGRRAVTKAQKETCLYIPKTTMGRLFREAIDTEARNRGLGVCRMSDAASRTLHEALESEMVVIFDAADDARTTDDNRPRLDNRHIRAAVRIADKVHRKSFYAQLEKDRPLSLRRPIRRRLLVTPLAVKPTKSATPVKTIKPTKTTKPVKLVKVAPVAKPKKATVPKPVVKIPKLSKPTAAPTKPPLVNGETEDAHTRKERHEASELKLQRDAAMEALKQAKASIISEEAAASAKRLEKNNKRNKEAAQKLTQLNK